MLAMCSDRAPIRRRSPTSWITVTTRQSSLATGDWRLQRQQCHRRMFAVVSHGVDLATDVDGLLGQLQIGAQQSVGGGGDGGAVTQTHRPQLGSELIEVLVEAGPHPSSSPTSGRAKHKHHHAVESTSDPPDPTIRNLGPNKHSEEECEPNFGPPRYCCCVATALPLVTAIDLLRRR